MANGFPIKILRLFYHIFVVGCFRLGKGISKEMNRVFSITNNAKECQGVCWENPDCKIWSWNRVSKRCHPRTGLASSSELIDAQLETVGPRDCSQLKMIWPEFREQFLSPEELENEM